VRSPVATRVSSVTLPQMSAAVSTSSNTSPRVANSQRRANSTHCHLTRDRSRSARGPRARSRWRYSWSRPERRPGPRRGPHRTGSGSPAWQTSGSASGDGSARGERTAAAPAKSTASASAVTRARPITTPRTYRSTPISPGHVPLRRPGMTGLRTVADRDAQYLMDEPAHGSFTENRTHSLWEPWLKSPQQHVLVDVAGVHLPGVEAARPRRTVTMT